MPDFGGLERESLSKLLNQKFSFKTFDFEALKAPNAAS